MNVSNQPKSMQMGAAMPGQLPGNWMPMPQLNVPGVPPGLEYLAQIDQVLVHQQIEILEVLTNIEMKNKYEIKNSLGQQIYFAYEESECCHRVWCREHRGFTLHVVDNMNQEVMRIVRPFVCCAGCCWCADKGECGYEIQIEAPPGQIVGYAKQTKYCWKPNLDVMDANRQCILKIRGPCWLCQTICCQDDIDFVVKSPDLSTDVGKISKQWGGFFRECITRADNFGITFPQDLDVRAKASLIGTMILIEFMIYEQEKNNDN
ncbi:phospholipid scramblase 1-like [Diadema antillarum]|uniref:phospholipid scramblase 1-like n=1 Tax=Diadema antillarum TaxID=105358 RepID=UPI003A8498C6